MRQFLFTWHIDSVRQPGQLIARLEDSSGGGLVQRTDLRRFGSVLLERFQCVDSVQYIAPAAITQPAPEAWFTDEWIALGEDGRRQRRTRRLAKATAVDQHARQPRVDRK